ncbi:hypothetical protein IQ287_28305 [Burkholderia sp. R-69927]|uniref:hypothetical protein n=1 Tax=Paraburkholderia domus TaxID=2793075 RepID=UPI0019132B3F|nr:hypothetical protein [Paraburkholderia domus]MBK5050795.1 hypothetical protein [Burkholderia sp. R-70006]MBK5089874.1 hypothetical protein [Burkholderia sp. R-69927]
MSSPNAHSNAIESMHMQLRKIVKNRGQLPVVETYDVLASTARECNQAKLSEDENSLVLSADVSCRTPLHKPAQGSILKTSQELRFTSGGVSVLVVCGGD